MKINSKNSVLVSSVFILGVFISFNTFAYAQEGRNLPPRGRSNEIRQNDTRLEEENVDREQEDVPQRGRALENRGVSTQNNLSNTQDSRGVRGGEMNQPDMKGDRETRVKNKCTQISQRLNRHQNEFKLKSQKRLNKYTRVVQRLESVSIKLEENEIDATQYNQYISELKTQVTAFNDLIKEYISNLEAKTPTLCDSETISTDLDSKKVALQAIIAKDKEIRMYIRDNIISYLRSIKPKEEESTVEADTPKESNDTESTQNTTTQSAAPLQ